MELASLPLASLGAGSSPKLTRAKLASSRRPLAARERSATFERAMAPKPATSMLLAPGGPGSAARLPGQVAFPDLDDHLVEPESDAREEMIRGERVVAMPALPPHADRQFSLGYVIGAHLKPGHVGAMELLTRVGPGSDFATDACVRKEGIDPATGQRHLEELAFEIVNEQSAKSIRVKAEDLAARGVRRFFAIFVKKGTVGEWSASKGAFQNLDLDGTIDDRCLERPLPVRALLEIAAADDAVGRALIDKRNPAIEAAVRQAEASGEATGAALAKRDLLLRLLASRGVEPSPDERARIDGCHDPAALDEWFDRALAGASASDLFA